MREAKKPSKQEFDDGYEIVSEKKPTNQPRQNARLYGEEFPSWEDESKTESPGD